MTVIDAWVLEDRRDLELGPISLTLAQPTPNMIINSTHLRLSYISFFGSSCYNYKLEDSISHREGTLNTIKFHSLIFTDFPGQCINLQALPAPHLCIHLSKCEEIPFISAGRGGLMMGEGMVGGGAIVIDLAKDQLLHFSFAMIG